MVASTWTDDIQPVPLPRELLHLHAIPITLFPVFASSYVQCHAHRPVRPDAPQIQIHRVRLNEDAQESRILAPHSTALHPFNAPPELHRLDAHYHINPGTALLFLYTVFCTASSCRLCPSTSPLDAADTPLREAVFRPLALRPALCASPRSESDPAPTVRLDYVWIPCGLQRGWIRTSITTAATPTAAAAAAVRRRLLPVRTHDSLCTPSDRKADSFPGHKATAATSRALRPRALDMATNKQARPMATTRFVPPRPNTKCRRLNPF